MSDSLWQTLLKSALETEEYEISCEECFEVLDLYTDLILEGTDPNEIMPLVKQHLQQCNCCTNELEAMIVMIQDALKNTKTSGPFDE
jgi:hypothetical protein